MTLCMAALCEDEGNSLAVVATDRMVTIGGFIEFEHTVPKMTHPSHRAVTLIAGDTLVGTRLAKDVVAELGGANPRVADISLSTTNRYVEVRKQEIENLILVPRGLTLDDFYAKHATLNAQVTMMLDQQMAQYNLGVELLLVGADEAGAHIYSVHNPGQLREHDVIGYTAIGSGAIHAVQAMIGFRHSAAAGLRETIFRAYAAKRRGEAAPGVGLDTDIAVVSASEVKFLGKDDLEKLAELYISYATATEDALVNELDKLSLEENGRSRDE